MYTTNNVRTKRTHRRIVDFEILCAIQDVGEIAEEMDLLGEDLVDTDHELGNMAIACTLMRRYPQIAEIEIIQTANKMELMVLLKDGRLITISPHRRTYLGLYRKVFH